MWSFEDEKLSSSKKELVLSNLSLVIAHRWAVINSGGNLINMVGALSSSGGEREREPENALVQKRMVFWITGGKKSCHYMLVAGYYYLPGLAPTNLRLPF